MDKQDPLERLSRGSRVRLGIMGGAFDPVHIAHLVTAEEALIQFDLDEVVFMPAGNPPHKTRHLAPAEARYLLVSVATASHPRFSVSRYEIDHEQVGYTVDTLEYVADLLGPEAQIFFITGADAVLDILNWKSPARVVELCTLIAATRPGHDLSRLSSVFEGLGPAVVRGGLEARVKVMEIPGLAISSSMIRERLSSGKPIRYLVPDGVAQLIEKTGLYLIPVDGDAGFTGVVKGSDGHG